MTDGFSFWYGGLEFAIGTLVWYWHFKRALDGAGADEEVGGKMVLSGGKTKKNPWLLGGTVEEYAVRLGISIAATSSEAHGSAAGSSGSGGESESKIPESSPPLVAPTPAREKPAHDDADGENTPSSLDLSRQVLDRLLAIPTDWSPAGYLNRDHPLCNLISLIRSQNPAKSFLSIAEIGVYTALTTMKLLTRCGELEPFILGSEHEDGGGSRRSISGLQYHLIDPYDAEIIRSPIVP